MCEGCMPFTKKHKVTTADEGVLVGCGGVR